MLNFFTSITLILFFGLNIIGCGETNKVTHKSLANSTPSDPGQQRLSSEPQNHRQILNSIFAPDTSCAEAKSDTPPLLRRLTRDEYQNTIRDLFGIDNDYRSSIPIDEQIFGFKNNTNLNFVSVDHAIAYTRTAGRIAEEFLDKNWTKIMDCSYMSDGRPCMERYLRRETSRIWRHPLTEQDIQDLLSVYDQGAEQSPREASKLVIRALLTAPAFLYRSEIGKSGQLDSFEWASALSYFFWASTPDDILLQKAKDGLLGDDANLIQEMQRLLSDSRAKRGINAFADSWSAYSQVLNVNKDPQRFPQFTSDLRKILARETEDFFDQMIRDRQAVYADLMRADYSVGPYALASFYRVPWTDDGKGGHLDFKGQERRGLLGHASILSSLSYATETNPVKRGAFIREHFLCEELLPPPPNINIQPPPPRQGATTRERFAAHSSGAICKGCHLRLDGVGFGLEDFDAVGLFRSSDNGKTVDRSGQLFDVDGQNRDFQGGMQLAEMLAQSQRAQTCFALQWFRLAHGRIESEADICAVRELGEKVRSGASIRDLILSILTQDSYRKRSF